MMRSGKFKLVYQNTKLWILYYSIGPSTEIWLTDSVWKEKLFEGLQYINSSEKPDVGKELYMGCINCNKAVPHIVKTYCNPKYLRYWNALWNPELLQ